ncbi:hypothetical protein O77CONTIG1_01075 [Leptolyngbya sp. O-77]|nr:hypothetical protein O77CONTIG1_01075 [Leptolyngbya sp. O-77]
MLCPILPRRLGWAKSDRPILGRQISIMNMNMNTKFLATHNSASLVPTNGAFVKA